jgi:putative NADPH-quinone reductase
MPHKYLVEMICDWIGAGKAYNNGSYTINDMNEWYESNKDRIVLHEDTRELIEFILYYCRGNERKLFIILRTIRGIKY